MKKRSKQLDNPGQIYLGTVDGVDVYQLPSNMVEGAHAVGCYGHVETPRKKDLTDLFESERFAILLYRATRDNFTTIYLYWDERRESIKLASYNPNYLKTSPKGQLTLVKGA